MKTFSLACLAALALGACATDAIGDTERLALYRANAGAPVDNFHYFRSLNGWTPLGDRTLAVWTRPNQAYLLELTGSCPGLEFTPAIAVSSQFGRVYSRFDHVIVARGDIPCRIERIRPVDVKALKLAENELRRDIEMAERNQPSGGT